MARQLLSEVVGLWARSGTPLPLLAPAQRLPVGSFCPNFGSQSRTSVGRPVVQSVASFVTGFSKRKASFSAGRNLQLSSPRQKLPFGEKKTSLLFEAAPLSRVEARPRNLPHSGTLRRLTSSAPQIFESPESPSFYAADCSVLEPAFALPALAAKADDQSRTMAKEQLEAFEDKVLSANWEDPSALVHSGPVLETEYRWVSMMCQPYLSGDPELRRRMSRVKEKMEVFYQCEEIRSYMRDLWVSSASGSRVSPRFEL